MKTALQYGQERWCAHQAVLSSQVQLDELDPTAGQRVAGVDVHYSDQMACATIVTLRPDDWGEEEVVHALGQAPAGYSYGFLAFRELPLVLEAAKQLRDTPDLFFYDGNGILHPRGLGAASHFGVLLGVATVGVSKNVAEYRPYPPLTRGVSREIGQGRGAIVVTRDETKPVCVSPGHRIDAESAIATTLQWSRYRIPEPIRRADQLARAHLRSVTRIP